MKSAILLTSLLCLTCLSSCAPTQQYIPAQCIEIKPAYQHLDLIVGHSTIADVTSKIKVDGVQTDRYSAEEMSTGVDTVFTTLEKHFSPDTIANIILQINVLDSSGVAVSKEFDLRKGNYGFVFFHFRNRILESVNWNESKIN